MTFPFHIFLVVLDLNSNLNFNYWSHILVANCIFIYIKRKSILFFGCNPQQNNFFWDASTSMNPKIIPSHPQCIMFKGGISDHQDFFLMIS